MTASGIDTAPFAIVRSSKHHPQSVSRPRQNAGFVPVGFRSKWELRRHLRPRRPSAPAKPDRKYS